MIHVLCTGVLIGAPQSRTSAKGTGYVTGTLKSTSRDGDAFVSFIAFNEAAQAELLAARPGDGLSIAGPGKLTTWTAKDGEQKHGLSVVVDRLLINNPRPRPKAARPRNHPKRRTPQRSSTMPFPSEAGAKPL